MATSDARRRRPAPKGKKSAKKTTRGTHWHALGWAVTLCAGLVLVLIGALGYPIVTGKTRSPANTPVVYDGTKVLDIYVSGQCYDGQCEDVRDSRCACLIMDVLRSLAGPLECPPAVINGKPFDT
jgi:hypothetical protein